MFSTSRQTLRLLAAALWLSGGVVLLYKGVTLLLEADSLQPENVWTWLTVILGLGIGWLKVKYIFSHSCRRNLSRISRLSKPMIWQFYRPGFLVFLTAMVIIGSTLSRMSHGNYPFLIVMVIIDFSLATALFGSSYVFWQQKAFRRTD